MLMVDRRREQIRPACARDVIVAVRMAGIRLSRTMPIHVACKFSVQKMHVAVGIVRMRAFTADVRMANRFWQDGRQHNRRRQQHSQTSLKPRDHSHTHLQGVNRHHQS